MFFSSFIFSSIFRKIISAFVMIFSVFNGFAHLCYVFMHLRYVLALLTFIAHMTFNFALSYIVVAHL